MNYTLKHSYLSVYPLFDLWWTSGRKYVHKHVEGFTGDYYSYLIIDVTLFRHKLMFSLQYNYKTTTEENIKKMYKAQLIKFRRRNE